MVALLTFFATLIATASFGAEFTLKVEFSKERLYQGEQLIAHYVIEGDGDSAEIEVSKFPEFQGFWSENLSLRQGNVPLLPLGMDSDFELSLIQKLPLAELKKRLKNKSFNKKRGNIGSYALFPMIGKEDLHIGPMKIIARDALNPQSQFSELQSQEPVLTVMRLPKLGAEHAPYFRGAVGQFNLNIEQNQIAFHSGEPTLIRIILTGKGNFPEIDRVVLPELKEIEVLSQKSALQGSYQFATKVFDTMVLTKNENEHILPSSEFIYFDPKLEKYQKLPIPEVKLFPAPPPPKDLGAPLLEFELRKEIRPTSPLLLPVWAWLFQGGLFFYLVIDLLRILLFKRFQKAKKSSKRQEFKLFRSHVQKLPTESASKEVYSWIEKLVEEKTQSLPPFTSRKKRLEFLRSLHGPAAVESVSKILTELDEALYSASHEIPQPPDIYLEKLRNDAAFLLSA